jgi:DNA helicase II / ATP-dependent DNA helicase PcrA
VQQLGESGVSSGDSDRPHAAAAPTFAYTPNQLEAIQTIDQNLQIVACAGAGKTQVVAERVAEILEHEAPRGIGPQNVVAFTFTERAGAELKDRIIQRVRARLGDIPGMADMYVGTIHGFCLQLLQGSIPEYFKYSVLNDVQARLLVDRASKQSGLSDLGLRRYVESALYLGVLGVLREGDVDPNVLEDHPALGALRKYQDLLDRKRYLDYTEILLRAVTAVYSDEELQDQLRERVKYLIVDEYQDVNPLQESLVRMLHDLGANLCVVGDDDQTIYQWRGSDVENILQFATRYPNVKVVPIEENYRSSKAVVDAARLVIENNNPDRLQKVMRSADSQAYERGDLLAINFDSPEQEAEWIASKITSMIGQVFCDTPGAEPRGLAYSDFAILLRSVRRNGDPIIAALNDAGVPVVVGGMTNLFDTPEVAAARALYLYMIRRIEAEELRTAWANADLGLDPARLESAIALMTEQREWDSDKRWSVYNLQRTFLGFLEEAGLREEAVPGTEASGGRARGELVYYNLGKFSQVISDFEQIHFQSDPARKYESFADFLIYQAPNYYPEGWQDAGYATPNAVQVMTVHQAKGMEYPVVFIPSLQRNRFPSPRQGGKGVWHVIPRDAVRNADGYDGTVEDERRLFYVALTRSKRYLFCSWAPIQDNRRYQRPSVFVSEFGRSQQVLTRPVTTEPSVLIESRPKREIANVALSFSELKYFFECPYEFKLRFMYGFNPPLHEALGYGKSLHDALAEVHKRALAGDIVSEDAADELVERHLNLPFAYPELRSHLMQSGSDAVRRYLKDNGHLLDKTEHVEQVVEINLGDGLVVNGRIDLIRRTDTKEIIVIDFKSTERAQEEDVTRMQLHLYALGYRELTGTAADLIEIYNLDESKPPVREQVDVDLEALTRNEAIRAGSALRENTLAALEVWSPACDKCDLVGICRDRPVASLVGGDQ